MRDKKFDLSDSASHHDSLYKDDTSLPSEINDSQEHKIFTHDAESIDSTNIEDRDDNSANGDVLSLNSAEIISAYYNVTQKSTGVNEMRELDQMSKLEKIDTAKSARNIGDEIPDKFSGWGLTSVIGCFFFNFNTWGANSAYALYLQEYLQESTFHGGNKYDYAIVGGLAFGSGLTFSPIINYFIGKVGLKMMILLGSLVNFAGILLASFSVELWQIYCTQGVLSGIGMAMICLPNFNILPQWFKGGPGGNRNLAMGIQAAGSGAGGIVYNIGLQPLLKKKSFRWSLRAQAIMCLGLNVVALLLVKSRNEQIRPVFKVYDRLVWRNFGCLCLVVWVMFTLLGYVVLMYNLGDFTRSLGYTSQQASVVSTMVPVGIIYGRPTVGYIADKIGPVNVTIVASWLVSLFTWSMWIPCRNYATAIVFAMFVGSLMGTIWLTLSGINASITGLKKFGIATSISMVSTGIFGFISPIIGMALKRKGPPRPDQYEPTAVFTGFCYFIAGGVLVLVRGYLIARNAKIDHRANNTEDDILKIKVSYKEIISSIFHYGKV